MDTDVAAPPRKPPAPPVVEAADAIPEAPRPSGFVRMSVLELSLAEAREVIEDSSWFDKTRIPVLFHFPQVTVDGYWDLKVKDHTEMVAYLADRGLFDGKP